jgi:PTS system galactitol-specific IIC component
LVIGFVTVIGIWAALRTWPKRMYMVAGASEEKAEETVQRRHTGKGGGLLPNKIGGPVETTGAEMQSDD